MPAAREASPRPTMRRLTVWSARPCIRQASRPVGDVPQGWEQERPTQERGGRRLRESGADKWTREKSKSCAKRSAARPCWRKTAGRSTSRKAPDARSSIAATAISSSSSTKAAAGSIPLSPAKRETCFRLPNILGAEGFVRSVRSCCGCRLASFRSAPAWRRPGIGRRHALAVLSVGDTVETAASSRAPAVAGLALSDPRRARCRLTS